MTSRDQGLPPKPDPNTGEPRPPKAPTYGRAGLENASQGKAPSPPRGCSPTLEWHVESNASQLVASIIVGLLMMAVFFVAKGTSWVGIWWIWALIIITPAIPYWGLRGTFYAAGSDWLRTKHGWVNTYDLILIRLDITTKVVLTLQDSTKRGVSVDITGVQINRRIWNLVYNGMLHSIANGTATDVNSYAKKVLKLPSPNR